METENKQERTVIHLEMDGKHYYFGSIANIYEYFDKDIIGISYGSLRNYGLSQEKPYQNNKCIIRKGVLLAKPSNRGRKKEE
ncbi:hypothetical protein [Dysgonomonas sp. 520]|uniref:hypothetical protein n=1 Tax=Dysgonomonas sp. 520 TaxID=2302931 RepID=UPI0013D4470F|nr:hypothetical protein [Dysgonomonas sp. 520]NDW08471.1 hypothetical protein [Dysgonomonas sp. 520]